MGALSAIEWTTHTFNPWWGCTKVGPGCDHCYAETFDRRVGGDHWGTGQPRRLIKDWSGPRKWNAAAEQSGERPWVFCASMADVFDNEVDPAWRARLWDLVRDCRNLRWQFVSKRIGNAAKMLPADWLKNFGHCGLIATVVNQAEADRDIYKLLCTPAAWRGLSMEPLLGPVDLTDLGGPGSAKSYGAHGFSALWSLCERPRLDWVIVGGESGSGAREFHMEWAADIVRQCSAAAVPCFVKQIGDKPMHTARATADGPALTLPVRASRKGKDMAEWPQSIRIREMPQVYSPTTPPAPSTGSETGGGRHG